jgi:putative photosynthetic complex assembly protein 2
MSLCGPLGSFGSVVMSQYAMPTIYPLFVWWFSTGIVMYLVGLPTWTFRWSLTTAVVVFFASLYGLSICSAEQTVANAYLAFTLTLFVWGAQEIGFLTGTITGPLPKPCPAQCTGSQRFLFAVRAIIYHELALLVSGLAIAAVTWHAPNQVALYTFLILWTMRLSSKLNLFLGVQYLNLEFLPAHLAFVGSYFAKRSMNMLFPFSVTLSTIVATLLIAGAFDTRATVFEVVGYSLTGVLLALAVLEHWFMFLPLPILALWSWSRSAGQNVPVIKPRPVEISPAKLARERLEASFRRAHYEQNAKTPPAPAVESSRAKPVQTVNARFP